MNNLHKIFSVVTTFLTVSLCILQDISNTKSFTMSRVYDKFCCLKIVLRVMLSVGLVNIINNLKNKIVFIIFVFNTHKCILKFCDMTNTSDDKVNTLLNCQKERLVGLEPTKFPHGLRFGTNSSLFQRHIPPQSLNPSICDTPKSAVMLY